MALSDADRLAALLREVEPFAPIMDDTASESQREMDKMETQVRVESAQRVAGKRRPWAKRCLEPPEKWGEPCATCGCPKATHRSGASGSACMSHFPPDARLCPCERYVAPDKPMEPPEPSEAGVLLDDAERILRESSLSYDAETDKKICQYCGANWETDHNVEADDYHKRTCRYAVLVTRIRAYLLAERAAREESHE